MKSIKAYLLIVVVGACLLVTDVGSYSAIELPDGAGSGVDIKESQETKKVHINIPANFDGIKAEAMYVDVPMAIQTSVDAKGHVDIQDIKVLKITSNYATIDAWQSKQKSERSIRIYGSYTILDSSTQYEDTMTIAEAKYLLENGYIECVEVSGEVTTKSMLMQSPLDQGQVTIIYTVNDRLSDSFEIEVYFDSLGGYDVRYYD